MKILVTGGAGFIGSSLVDSLLSKGNEIIAIDSFDDFYPRDIKEANISESINNQSFKLIEGDIRNQDLVIEITKGIDVIVHLAAKAGVRPSISNPSLYQDVNERGTLNLLEAAKINKIKQFVFASSSSVYGVNENLPWTESLNLFNLISPYAASKLSSEHMGHVYSHLYDIRFIALRLFTVYGPRQRPDLAIHKFAKKILDGDSIDLYGNGATARDYTFIDDIVQGIELAINYKSSDFDVFNLGKGEITSLNELVGGLEKAFGKTVQRNYMEEQPGDVPKTYADISKAQNILGYSPKTSVDEGLEEFKDWFLDTHTN
jgi:UDP-glucuronate 4-epimerase